MLLSLIIIFVSIIQSLFGVGVLLFGTPLLLISGYSFINSLLILLPISASINILQIIKDYKYINIGFYKNILFLTVPFIIIVLLFIIKDKIDINLFVGILLVFVALKDKIDIFKNVFERLLKYNKSFYVFMGIIHGATNLGGAFLTAKIFHTNLNKYEKRATIAISYLTFAIFQIITILFLDIHYNFFNLIYIFFGIITYVLVNKLVFHKISDNKYDRIFSIFLVLSGVALIIKGI